MQVTMCLLRGRLFAYYKLRRAADPEWSARASQLWSLTLKMIGSETDPHMATKANETVHLFDFLVVFMQEFQAELEAYDSTRTKFLIRSGLEAQKVNTILSVSGDNISATDAKALLDAYTRHVSFFLRAGGLFYPKHHLMFHLCQRVLAQGNPRRYWTYRDESLNGVVVKLARASHKLRFMETVHDRYRWLEALDLCCHMF